MSIGVIIPLHRALSSESNNEGVAQEGWMGLVCDGWMI